MYTLFPDSSQTCTGIIPCTDNIVNASKVGIWSLKELNNSEFKKVQYYKQKFYFSNNIL